MDIIKVKDFTKSYGSKAVHKGVSFNVKKGECLGLIGGSGVGKSVILRSLIGLEQADSGSIFINDIDITRFNESQLVEIRKKVAFAFQGGALFDSMTVFDNVAYPLREHTKKSEAEIKERVHSILASFELDSTEELLPSSLSGGMQKRLGLARSIMLEPEIILYDEPTAGLDPFNTKIIQDMILEFKKSGVTSILVTHDMPTAFRVCDRLAMLMSGRIAAVGPTNELRNKTIVDNFIKGIHVKRTRERS